MLYEKIDRYLGLVAWKHAPPYGVSDFVDHIASLERLAADVALASRLLMVFTTPINSPGPGALHRRQFYDALCRFPPETKAVILTPNPITYGAVTAFRWLGTLPLELHTFSGWGAFESSSVIECVGRARCQDVRTLMDALEQIVAMDSKMRRSM